MREAPSPPPEPGMAPGLYCDRWPVNPSTLIHSVALSTGEVIEIYSPERLRELGARKAKEMRDEAEAELVTARPSLKLLKASETADAGTGAT